MRILVFKQGVLCLILSLACFHGGTALDLYKGTTHLAIQLSYIIVRFHDLKRKRKTSGYTEDAFGHCCIGYQDVVATYIRGKRGADCLDIVLTGGNRNGVLARGSGHLLELLQRHGDEVVQAFEFFLQNTFGIEGLKVDLPPGYFFSLAISVL